MVSQYAHTAWRARDGAPSGAVLDFAQTKDGYLWVGTEFGLLRFDGARFVEWQPPAGTQLPPGRVTRLLASSDGSLWIGTEQGLASWKDGRLTLHAVPGNRGVGALAEDRLHTVWVGTLDEGAGSLCAIERDRTTCEGGDGNLGIGVNAIHEDRQGRLWVGTTNALWQWTPGPPKRLATSQPVDAIVDVAGRPLLVSMLGGVQQLADGRLQTVSLGERAAGKRLLSLQADRDGSLWIGTSTGILHASAGRVDGYARSDGLSADYVRGFFEDREGNVWVATQGGMDRFRELAVPALSTRQGLAREWPSSVLAARDGSVWIATFGGLHHLKDGELTVLRRRALATGGPAREIVDAGLVHDSVFTLYEDPRGRLWAGTQGGIALLEDGRFSAVAGVPAADWVWCITGDASGRTWISQVGGLYQRKPDGAIEAFEWPSMESPTAALAMVPDASGGVWLGYRTSGLVHAAPDGRVVRRYTTAEGLGTGPIEALRLDADGTLWASTAGGLSRLKDERIATLARRNGLPCDTVHWFVEDDAHAFWLGTACGLVRVARPEIDGWIADPARSVKTTVFDVSDGFLSSAVTIQFTPQASKAVDGRIWFVSRDGVGVIDPNHLRINGLPPPVQVEQVIADGHALDVSSGAVRLPPRVRDVTIDYTAPSLSVPEKVSFRFRLEGQDADWRQVVNERRVHYSNLAPGHYRFRVTASNNHGVWNEQGASLDMEVAAAFWQTAWFRALCTLVLAALLVGAYRLRVRRLRERFALTLDARVAERTRIARDLHDTLLQSFQGLLLRFQTVLELMPSRPAEARAMLASTIDQAASAITEGRDAVQGLRDSVTESDNLGAAVRSLADDLRVQDGGGRTPTVRVEVHGVSRPLHPIVRDETFRIAGEALRNVLRHAGATQVEVEIAYDRPHLRLRVRDDGKGMSTEALNRPPQGHFGLQGMRERAAVIGGSLAVWSAVDAGTEVELTVPARNAYVAASLDESSPEAVDRLAAS